MAKGVYNREGIIVDISGDKNKLVEYFLISRHLSVKHFPSLRFHCRLFTAQKPPSGFCFHCGDCSCISHVIIVTSQQHETTLPTNNCSEALILIVAHCHKRVRSDCRASVHCRD